MRLEHPTVKCCCCEESPIMNLIDAKGEKRDMGGYAEAVFLLVYKCPLCGHTVNIEV